MNSLKVDDVDINLDDIGEVYIDQKRNVKITLKDNKSIIVKSPESRKIYSRLSQEE